MLIALLIYLLKYLHTKNRICTISGGKSFSLAHHLRRHIHTVHEGHKDYKCEDCKKAFARSEDLEEHLHIVHDGYKDHKCEFCGKSFVRALIFKKHIHTVHDGNKDHKCESYWSTISKETHPYSS